MRNLKNWKLFTNEEKLTNLPKIVELKGAGFSWTEIGEIYSTSPETIRSYYEDHKIPKTGEIAEKIINGEFNTQISMQTITTLIEKIEQLELEVATIKSLQVETAAIERLTNSEYKYFITDRRNNEEFKFKTLEDTVVFIASKTNSYITESYVEYQLKDKSTFDFKYLRITGDFKNDIDNSNDKINLTIYNINELTQNLEDIKKRI